MDLSSIPRPEGISPTAIPVIQWDTESCNGDLARRKALLDNGWEPTNCSVVMKPTTVLTPGGSATKTELVKIWGFRRVRNVLWVEATEQQTETPQA